MQQEPLVALYSYYLYRTREGLMHRGKYTIGYITGSSLTVGSGWTVEHYFIVNKKRYVGSKGQEEEANSVVGNRYLVNYDSLSPDWHQIYYEAPIPDSIRQAPRNGWRWRPWPDPEHPELSGPTRKARPAHDSTEAAMWQEMEIAQKSSDSLNAITRRAP